MESPKEHLKQFESFKSKLKFNGLFFLQDHIRTLILTKKENNFAGNIQFSHDSSDSCGVLIFIMLTQKMNSFVSLTNQL